MICRILGPVLVVLLLISGFILFANPTVWWKIELSVAVSGTYKCQNSNHPFSGQYSISAEWRGAMERDNGDYILYQGSDRITSLDWEEDNNKSKPTGSGTPKLKLNYVLRKQGIVHFDFEIFSVMIPLNKNKKGYNLILPRSAENESLHRKIQYNKGVVSGSNGIQLLENRIYKEKTIQETFNWKWFREQGNLSSKHSVEVVIRIKKIGKDNA